MANRDHSAATGSWRSFLTNPLLLALLGVSLIPMLFMGIMSYRTAAAALEQQAFKQLETVNAITGKAVERYFDTLHQEIAVLAETETSREALREFTAGMATLLTDDKVTDAGLAAARRELEAFYTGDFATEYEKRTGTPKDMRPLAEVLDDDAAYAQYLYLRTNPNPIGSKHLLDAAADGSAYTKAHARWHPFFRSLREKYGVSDVFLIDASQGRVVYTASKEVDFCVSMRTGPLAQSNLAAAFQQVAAAGRRGAVTFGRFQRYLPSCDAPAAFLMASIHDGRTFLGALAFQLPLDQIDRIVGETTGMGRTGETYAIGPDREFRSNSRFAAEMGVKTTVINGKFKVDTPAVKAALEQGTAGTGLQTGHRGKPALVSWRPVTVHRDAGGGGNDLRWALVSEIDAVEVRAPISRLLRLGLTVFGLTAAAVLAVSSLIARRLTSESRRQATLVGGIVDNTHALASASEELTSVSQQMSAAAEETTAQANLVSAAAEQVSGNARTVSGSIENLVASIHDIARNAQSAATTARQAVDMATTTSTTMNALGHSSNEIGAVVKVINSIAEQTNLLALNATIEAASAGEAGRGFAVVANEVKELARQSAAATDDIRRQVSLIQENTANSMEAIDDVASVIEQVSQIASSIAAAVEEQSATTSEIVRSLHGVTSSTKTLSENVQSASSGASEVSRNIHGVSQAASDSAKGASRITGSAGELTLLAGSLREIVTRFKL